MRHRVRSGPRKDRRKQSVPFHSRKRLDYWDGERADEPVRRK